MSRQCLQRSDVFYLTLQRFTVSTYIGDGLQSEDFQTFSFHFQNMTVENYCVTYHCGDDDVGDWTVHLKSCLCMKNDSVIFDQLGENNYLMINLITKTLYTLDN